MECTNGRISHNLSQRQFCMILAYFGQNLVSIATSLKHLQSQMFYLDWPTTKTPVIRNHIPVVSRRNAFICILVPKLVAMVTPLCPLCTGRVTYQFPNSTNPMAKPNSAWIWRIQLKLWPFCDIFAYFGQKLVAIATSIRPLQSEMSSLDCSTTKTPCYK